MNALDDLKHNITEEKVEREKVLFHTHRGLFVHYTSIETNNSPPSLPMV